MIACGSAWVCRTNLYIEHTLLEIKKKIQATKKLTNKIFYESV